MIETVVLAAGAGRRLGVVAKATLVVAGETYLARIGRLSREIGAAPPKVVVGRPHLDETADEARRLGLEVVVNPEPERGMGSSVAVAFAHLVAFGSKSAAALLWPVDHPMVRASTVRDLCARVSPARVVIPVHAGRGGHPVLVGADLWPELCRAGELPEGARSVFRANPSRAVRIDVDDAGVTRDVDSPEQLL